MPQAVTSTDAGLATAMRISISRLARRLRVERLGLGGAETALSDIQLAALAALDRHEAMSPGELAEHEKVQPPSMTRVIASLAELGFVARSAHPADGRQVLVSVSDAGIHLIEAERRASQEWLKERLDRLDPDERKTLLMAADLMTALVDESA